MHRQLPPAADPRPLFRYRVILVFGMLGCCLWGPALTWVVPKYRHYKLQLFPVGLLAGSVAGYITCRLVEPLVYADSEESAEVSDDDFA
jgi:hypothetical protein